MEDRRILTVSFPFSSKEGFTGVSLMRTFPALQASVASVLVLQTLMHQRNLSIRILRDATRYKNAREMLLLPADPTS